MQANVKSKEEHNKELLSIRSKRAFYISLSILFTAVIFGTMRIIILSQDQIEGNTFNIPWIFGLIAISLAGSYFAQTKRPKYTAYILLLTISIFILLLAWMFKGAVTALSGSITAVGVAIILLIVPSQKNTRNIIIVVLISLGLLVFDQFGPADRIVVTPFYSQIFRTITYIALSTLFVYGISRFNQYTIRNKVLISIMAVSILSVIVISVTVNYASRQSIIMSASNDIKQIADRGAIAIGELLLQKVKILETAALSDLIQETVSQKNASYSGSEAIIADQLLARDRVWRVVSDSNVYVTDVLENPLANNLRLIRETFPENVEIFVTDKYGGLIASTNKITGFYQADEAWWTSSFADGNGAVFIGSPDFDESANVYAVNIAVPVYSTAEGSREVVGILRTTLNLDSFNELLALSFDNLESETIEILINNNLEIEIPMNGDVLIKQIDPNQKEIFDTVIGAPDGFHRFTMNDSETEEAVDTIITTSQIQTYEKIEVIENLDWYAIVSKPTEEALTAVEQQSQLTVMLSVFTVIISAAAAFLLGHLLTKPIVQLTKTAQKIEAGDYLVRAEITSNDEVGQLASAINNMTHELGTTLNQLEMRVASRTRALQTASDISRELSSILDPEKLINTIVTKIQNAYAFYHVQIYLWNDDKSMLDMKGGTGAIGKQLIENSHQAELGQGLVGRAAEIGLPAFVPDVTEAEDWLPNELLPETVSEIAIPILVGEEVVGVLDVQESEVGKISIEDVDILQLVASQVGVALQNAQSYKYTQSKADQDALILEINRKILATTSVESAMKVAVSEIGKHMATKTRIQLGHPVEPEIPQAEEL